MHRPSCTRRTAPSTFTLREEFAQWLEEAQSAERREELANVYRHIDEMEREYQRRREAAMRKLATG